MRSDCGVGLDGEEEGCDGGFGGGYSGAGGGGAERGGDQRVGEFGKEAVESVGENLESFGKDELRRRIAENSGTGEVFVGEPVGVGHSEPS